MVRPEKGGAEKARSVSARRDEGDKNAPVTRRPLLPINTNRHRDTTSLVYASTLSLPVRLFLLHVLLCLSTSAQGLTHRFASSKKKRKEKKKMPSSSSSSCLYSITASLHYIILHVLQSPLCLPPVMKLDEQLY